MFNDYALESLFEKKKKSLFCCLLSDSSVLLLSDVADTEDSIIWVFLYLLKFIISESMEERKDFLNYGSFLAKKTPKNKTQHGQVQLINLTVSA